MSDRTSPRLALAGLLTMLVALCILAGRSSHCAPGGVVLAGPGVPGEPRVPAADPSAGPRARSWPERFEIGRRATAEEVEAWDTDVRPDGRGLPPGSGSVAEGAGIYAQRCAHCHGPTGVEGPDRRLAGRVPGDGFPFAVDRSVTRTIGNYWPYATTVFDYTRRTMPFESPGSLSPDETYALTAFMLFLNRIVAAEAVLDAGSLVAVAMPARDRFVPDDRPDGGDPRQWPTAAD